MILAWHNLDSHAYGMMTVSYLIDDGSTTVSVVKMADNTVVHRETKSIVGVQDLPLGIEQVPQLELRLRLTDEVISYIITPLAEGKHIIVIVASELPSIVAGYQRIRTAPYDEPQNNKQIVFVGVIAKSPEVDVVKDDGTKLVVDEITHYAASIATPSALLQRLQSLTNGRVTTNDSWYDVHPEADIQVGTVGDIVITGCRFFDPYNATQAVTYLHAIGQTIGDAILSLIPSPLSAAVTLTVTPPMLAIERRRWVAPYTYETITYGIADPNVYLLTDYRSDDANKQYWGIMDAVVSARSLRDHLRDLGESCLHLVTLRSGWSFAVNTFSVAIDLDFRPVLSAHAGSAMPPSSQTGRKLFYSVVSSVEVTADKWVGNKTADYSISSSKRWNDYGVRLALHNVPLAKNFEKGYSRYDGPSAVLRPNSDQYDRSAVRYIYIRNGDVWLRPARVRPLLASGTSSYWGDAATVDGITYTSYVQSVPQLSEDSRYIIGNALLQLFGRASQSLCEYRLQRAPSLWMMPLSKYGIEYLLQSETDVYSGVATWRLLRYAP